MTTDAKTPDLAAVGVHGITAEEWRESLELLGAYNEAQDMDEAAEVAGRMFALIKRTRDSAQADLAALRAERDEAREGRTYWRDEMSAACVRQVDLETKIMELDGELDRTLRHSMSMEEARDAALEDRDIWKRIADRRQSEISDLQDKLMAEAAANAALRERLAVGEADALRLDWMERHHASIWWGGILERREGPDPNAVALEWLDAGDLVNQSERFRTLREAIDAVLAARTPGGRREAE